MGSERKTFYVTTPIYYVNDAPHIGHSYTTVLADTLNRYHGLMGRETFFLTGTDEHGQKVQQAAQKKGLSPKEHCDLYSRRFKETWQRLEIGYDRFIRTTDADHVAFVRDIFSRLHAKGEIYEKVYEGWYSVSEERFFTEKELVDGKDPISGRPVEWISEKNYFFRMSKYQEWLIGHIQDNPDFILPDFRRNEVLGFLRQPLNDLCISRPKSRLAWGIELPFDSDYVAYVWVDALFNYRSGVEGRSWKDGSPVWPADYHLIGKDILTTHAVYWPTLLKAVDLPLPRHILAHGWWLRDEARMSKTTGNVVSPMEMMEKYGTDAFRYFLIREMAVGQDASYSEDAFIIRLNSDLANDLGNGINRVLNQAAQHLDSKLSREPAMEPEDEELQRLAEATVPLVLGKVQELKLSFAIEDTLQLVRAVNRYLERTAPWKLAKEGPQCLPALNRVLWHAAEALRIASTLLAPVMPGKMAEALSALGATPGSSPLGWAAGPELIRLAPKCHLFPRIQNPKEDQAVEAKAGKAAQTSQPASSEPFSKVHLRAARITLVENHPDAEALYKLEVELGGEKRTVCAGLRKHLSPEALQGRMVALVSNLKPAKLRGIESHGMVLAAERPDGSLAVVEAQNAQPGEDIVAEGIPLQPKAGLTLKDFDKCPLTVEGGAVTYAGRTLATASGRLKADAPDGASVR